MENKPINSLWIVVIALSMALLSLRLQAEDVPPAEDLYRKYHQSWSRPPPADPFDFSAADERMRLMTELENLARAGDVLASFYAGLAEAELAERLARRGEVDMAAEPYRKALSFFKAASEGGVPSATWNVALIYAQGLGVPSSKLAAAEWYYKAGEQYLQIGDRENALACLERINASGASGNLGKKLEAKLYPSEKKSPSR